METCPGSIEVRPVAFGRISFITTSLRTGYLRITGTASYTLCAKIDVA